MRASFFVLSLVAGLLAGEVARADEIRNPTATFAGLDKITGRIISFDVAIDETVQFGTLQITPRVCLTRPQTEAPLTESFLEVDEVESAKNAKRIFSGWMFAASPGLHGVEHPVYDIWLKDCKGGKDVVASPAQNAGAAKPPPPNAQAEPTVPPKKAQRTIKPQEPEAPEEPKAAPPQGGEPPAPGPADLGPAPAPETAPNAAPAPNAPAPNAAPAPNTSPAPLPPPVEVGAPPGAGNAADPGAPPQPAAPPKPKKPKKPKPPPPPADVQRQPLEPAAPQPRREKLEPVMPDILPKIFQ